MWLSGTNNQVDQKDGGPLSGVERWQELGAVPIKMGQQKTIRRNIADKGLSRAIPGRTAEHLRLGIVGISDPFARIVRTAVCRRGNREHRQSHQNFN